VGGFCPGLGGLADGALAQPLKAHPLKDLTGFEKPVRSGMAYLYEGLEHKLNLEENPRKKSDMIKIQ